MNELKTINDCKHALELTKDKDEIQAINNRMDCIRISNLKTVKECKNMINNVRRLGRTDLIPLIERKSIMIQTRLFMGSETYSEVEEACIRALLTFERVKGRPATRTRPMIPRYGIVGTVDRLVSRHHDSTGIGYMQEAGMEDWSFEAVVIMYRESFSDIAFDNAVERLRK